MSNRPLPPIVSGIVGAQYASGIFDVLSFIQATNSHGLLTFDQSATGWQTVLDVSGSGVLLWDLMGWDNNTGVATNQVQHKITIDGVVARSSDVTPGAGNSTGIRFTGLLMIDDVTANLIQGASSDYIPFETDLKIESYAQTITNFDLSVAYQYMLT